MQCRVSPCSLHRAFPDITHGEGFAVRVLAFAAHLWRMANVPISVVNMFLLQQHFHSVHTLAQPMFLLLCAKLLHCEYRVKT
jgi:hypothetical protein